MSPLFHCTKSAEVAWAHTYVRNARLCGSTHAAQEHNQNYVHFIYPLAQTWILTTDTPIIRRASTSCSAYQTLCYHCHYMLKIDSVHDVIIMKCKLYELSIELCIIAIIKINAHREDHFKCTHILQFFFILYFDFNLERVVCFYLFLEYRIV